MKKIKVIFVGCLFLIGFFLPVATEAVTEGASCTASQEGDVACCTSKKKCKCTQGTVNTSFYSWQDAGDCSNSCYEGKCTCYDEKTYYSGDTWCGGDSDDYPKSCSNGVIKTGSKCSKGCYKGDCNDCYLGEKKCVGNVRYYCDSSYDWATKDCGSDLICKDGSCVSKSVNGVCGADINLTDQYYEPDSAYDTLCDEGTATEVADYNVGNFTYVGWTWNCTGENGGTTATCYAYKTCSKVGGEGGLIGECIGSNSYSYDPNFASTARDYCTSVLGGTPQNTHDCDVGSKICCAYSTNYINCNPETNDKCNNCEECLVDSPGNFNCHPINVTCGGSSACAWSSTGASCSTTSTSKTVSLSRTADTSGKFNWSCVDGSTTCKTCSVTNLPTISAVGGVCNSAIDKKVVQVKPVSGDLCSSGDPVGFKTTGDTYSWTCDGTDGQCPTVASTNPSCWAMLDTTPTVDSIVIKNPKNVSLTADASGRNHSCEIDYDSGDIFQFLVTVTDKNGVSDIGTVTLRFRSDSGKITTTIPVTPDASSGVATFNVDVSDIPYDTYHLEVQAVDKDGPTSEWMDTGRDFKVWDCLVNITGTVYDGSAGISCFDNKGFSNRIPGISGFGVVYKAGSGSPRNMVVTSAPDFGSGDKLYWNSDPNYVVDFNNLGGDDPSQAKIEGKIKTCVNSLSLDPKLADPYSDSPSLNVEYSSIMDQDAWFSVTDGSVFSAGKVENYAPVTCNENCSTANKGIVWSGKSSDLSPYDDSPGKYNDVRVKTPKYTYTYLKNRYYYTLGVGTTVVNEDSNTPKSWKDISNLKGILFIDGDLIIDQDIKDLTKTDFRMILTSGNITIASNVNQVDAVLFGKTITVTGTSDTQLVINGSIYGFNSVNLSRSFTNPSANNATPATKINYDPSIPFRMPKEVAKAVTEWRMQ